LGVGTAGRVDIQPRCAKSVPSYQMKKSPSEPGVPFRTPGLAGKNSSRAHSITRKTASWSCGLLCLCVCGVLWRVPKELGRHHCIAIRAVREGVFRRRGITLIPTLRRIIAGWLQTLIAGWLQTLKEPFGTNRVYLLLKQGASPKRKIDTAAQADGAPPPLPSSRGHLVVRGGSHVAVEPCSRNSTPRKLAGIRTFIESCVQIDQRGDVRACVLLAGPGAQAAAQELSRVDDIPE